MKRWIAAFFAAWLALGVVATPAEACAPAPPSGIQVDILTEDALIVWDAASRTQHFIRRADFHSARMAELRATGFGFLVPTPSKPELAEAPDDLFARAAQVIAPQIVRQKIYEPVWSACVAMFWSFSRSSGEPTAQMDEASVEVLDRKRVAGFDAVVLKANDAEALGKWLGDNGYAFRPALKGWLEDYVAKGWIITAFKIAATEQGSNTSAVRMSFQTDAPFFPYREPVDQMKTDGPRRALRVFLLAGERMHGKVGTAAWPGEQIHAAPVDAATWFAGALPANAAFPKDVWLNAYVDHASPRPGTDELWFGRSDDQTEKRVPPIVVEDITHVPLLIDVWLLLSAAIWLVVRRRKRQR